MPFAIHALNVVDVIILLTFRVGIGLLWRCCNLFMGKLPAHQIVTMEAIIVFTGTW